VSEHLGHGLAEIIFCVGFLFVYLADELLHFCCGEAIQHSHGVTDEESQLILPPENQQQSQQHHHHSHHSTYGATSEHSTKVQTCEEHQNEHDVEDEEINERICHTSHVEPCSQTLAGTIGLLAALTIHSLLEGLAIGVNDTATKVLLLFVAVASHKFVVGFCLGVELAVSPGATFKRHFIAILVFSAGSVLGIGLGMTIVDATANQNLIYILQGIAGGTLLYVTLCEVLPREKARWHKSHVNRAAGLIQFVAFVIGFITMTVMNEYIHDDD
jgi:zinc transporter 1/2/3